MAGAVDMMNYLFTQEAAKKYWDEPEDIQFIFTGVMKRPPEPRRWWTPDDYVTYLDSVGIDKSLVNGVKMASYKKRQLIMDHPIEEVYAAIKDHPTRLYGIAGYNPWEIVKSTQEVRRAVKEFGFKGVYIHCFGFGFSYDDRRWYPLYEECAELGVPVSMQVGHSLELMPSDIGRPIHLDPIALDFPELTIIGAHTGWPWCEEMIAMAYKHPNVYLGIDAHFPRYLEPNVITFMNTRGQDKTVFGTNGLDAAVIMKQMEELPMRPESKQKVLRDNAVRLYKL